MGNKSTFTAELRVKAIVDEAQQELEHFGKSLKHAWQGGEPPKNFLKTYEQMRARLESLRQLSEKGFVNTSELRQAESDFKAFQKDIRNLAVEFKLMSAEQKRAMLSTAEQAGMKARAAAIKEYTDALKKNQEIAKQREALEKERAKLVKDNESKRNAAQTTLDVQGPVLKALEKRGVLLSKEAEAYKNNLEWAQKYEDKIKRLQNKPNKTEADNKTLAKTQKDLEALDLKTGKNQYEREKALYDTEVNNLRQSVKAATEEIEGMDSALEKIDKKIGRLTFTDEAKQLETLKNRLKELGIEGLDSAKDIEDVRKVIQKLDDKALARVEQALNDMTSSLSTMGGEALQMGRGIDIATESIKRQDEALRNQEAFEGRIKQFLGMTGAVELLRRAVSSAFNTIKELDTAMAEMAVVTDTDISGYWDQLPEYTARANELGLAIKDVYQADTLFYQQGLKTEEVVALSTQTMKMARIAGLDTAEATDRMTAALRGFNMELNEANAQKIADVYSELAAITASDVNEISSAMTKTASIAASAGMEFETTAAFLSQIIETTRESAETAGTALKTVIARFQELKKDPSEIGEVDGEIVDANKIETALRSVGVALRDSSGQFRELDDVFLELSAKWNTLDTNTQRYIATIAAGSRQQSRFIAMMSDYSRTQELVTAATSSAGASNEQFEKTMESLDAKLNELKNAWDEFSMGILESDLVKAGVDILTTFLKVINKMTSAFDGLGGSLMKIVTVIGMFNMAKKIFAKIKEPVINALSDIVTQAFNKGEEAGKSWALGVQKGAEEAKQMQTGGDPQQDSNPSEQTEQPKGFKETVSTKIKDVTGISKLGAVKKYNEAQKKLEGADYKELKQKQADAKKAGWGPKGGKRHGEAAKQARADYDEATKKINQYEKATKGVAKTSKEAWKEVGQGVSQIGSTVAGVGIGISMLGGALEEMGVEGSKWITTIGNGITMLGSTASAVGPTVTKMFEKASAGGKKSMLKLGGWAAVVVAAIIAISVAISEAMAAAEEASPEAKLKRAKTATEETANAAKDAANAYEDMRDSLEEIEDAQKDLKGLARNTDAWRTAVTNLNAEILELINKYPQLAKFVEHTDGVMTIDFNDAGVQGALMQARQVAQNAQIVATGAQISLLEAQDAAAYDRLDRKAKIEYIDPETAAGWASFGADFSTVASMGGAGAGIGSAVNVGYGTAIGAAVGLIAGAITIATTEGGEAAGKAAAEAAEAHNEKTSRVVEGVAEALASGKLIDNGSGYELAEGITNDDLFVEYNVKLEELNEFYNDLSNAATELREFGKTLNETSSAMEAYYSSLAVQIYNTLDKTGWDSNTSTIGDNIIDDDRIKGARESILKKLEDVNMLDKYLDDATKKRIEEAVQGSYGANSRVVEDKENGGYKIIDGEGNTKMSNVTSDALKNIVATYEAEQEVIDIGKMMPQITRALVAGFKNSGDLSGYNESDIEKAVIAAFDNETGAGLTEEQMDMLNTLSYEQLTKIFDSSETLQKAFGTASNFITKFKTPVNEAGKAFTQSADVFNKASSDVQKAVAGLTSGAQFGLASDEHLGKVYRLGSEQEIANFEAAFAKVISAENGEAIAAHMNSISDWSNLEDLINLEYVLQEQYGVSTEDAKALISSMIEATNASTTLNTSVTQFGALYEALQKMNKALSTATELAWEYENVLKRSGSTEEITKNLQEQKESYYQAAQQAIRAYEESQKDRADHYGTGATLIDGVDLTKYVSLDPETGMYDPTEFNRRINEANFGAENQKVATEWFNSLIDKQKTGEEHLKTARDSYAAIQEIKDIEKESYWDLYDIAADTITSELEKVVEVERDLLDATESANSKIVQKLQEQINKSRQQKENEKTEEDIQNLQSQLSYLQMDSSGSYLEQLELQKQIDSAKEDYQNTLIDQSIQSLEDANAEAAEQRERQIEIAEQQLEMYKSSAKFEQDVFNLLDEIRREYVQAEHDNKVFQETELGQRIKKALTEGLTPEELDKFWTDLGVDVGNSAEYGKDTAGNTDDVSSSAMEQLLDAIKSNTSIENLTAAQSFELVASAGANESKFSTATKFNIEGDSQYSTYKKEGRPYDLDAASSYVSRVASIATDTNRETLVKNNTEGEALYNSAPSIAKEKGLLDIDKFYEKVNTVGGEGITVGNKTFSYDTVSKWLSEGKFGDIGTGYGYGDYVQAFTDNNSSYWTESAKAKAKTYIDERQKDYRNFYGMSDVVSSENYSTWLTEYSRGGGTEEEFQEEISAYITKGVVKSSKASIEDEGWFKELLYQGMSSRDVVIDGTRYRGTSHDGLPDGMTSWEKKGGTFYLDGRLLYTYYYGDQWLTEEIKDQTAIDKYLEYLHAPQYKTGGLADFTGPAWLDGTKSHPELVLNARDTSNFIQLKDILSEIMNRPVSSDTKSKSSGDNYFEIEINVESIDNDYDVEQIANKIRNMIYDDATYRNVNALNKIR